MPVLRDEAYYAAKGEKIAANRKEALEQGILRYYGNPCKYGHLPAIRFTANHTCQNCFSTPALPPGIGAIKARDEPIASTKQEAFEMGVRRYFGTAPCVRGHFPVIRSLVNGKCQECSRYLANEKTRSMQNDGTWNQHLQKLKEKRDADPEKGRKRCRDWYARFPEKSIARAADRRALELNAIPPWADKKQIIKIYAKCRKLSENNPSQYAVDHIVPLKGKKVCGLHTQANLRILSSIENIQKFNHFDSENLEMGIDKTAEYYAKGWTFVKS